MVNINNWEVRWNMHNGSKYPSNMLYVRKSYQKALSQLFAVANSPQNTCGQHNLGTLFWNWQKLFCSVIHLATLSSRRCQGHSSSDCYCLAQGISFIWWLCLSQRILLRMSPIQNFRYVQKDVGLSKFLDYLWRRCSTQGKVVQCPRYLPRRVI